MKKLLFIIPALFLFSCGTDDVDVSPTAVQINALTVLNYPMLMESGTVWDFALLFEEDENPDPFFSILSGSNPVYTSGEYYNASGGALSFSELNIELNASSQYVFGLYDWDIDGIHETMGEFYFNPYSYSDGTPATKVLSSGNLTVEFSLSYIY